MPTRARSSLTLLAALGLLAGCGDDDFFSPDLERPEELDARYEWIFTGWNGTRPAGHPSVLVTWDLPVDWRGDPFRVYARRSGQSFSLIGTTTSCENGTCRFVDINVVGGRTYEYYVSTTDERTDTEFPSDYRVAVDVPTFSPPPAPRADSVFALDDALWVRWRDGGSGDDLWKYQVVLVNLDGEALSPFYHVGESDGTGYLDLRARNGASYGYRIAALDTLGQVSELSAVVSGVPRPDYHAELVYAYGDSTARSGFRFAAADSLDPVLSGDSQQAQWRLEVANGRWQIRPLGETEVVSAGRTTALVCGPASDRDCRAVFQAPTTGYTRSPLAIDPEFSCVFRVRGSDGRIHYGVVRASILGSSGGNALMIFDWAYQLRPDDPRLARSPG